MLITRNIRSKGPADGATQLMPNFIGPFDHQKVGNVANKLELPESIKRIHSVVHVSLLKGWKQGDREQPSPTTVQSILHGYFRKLLTIGARQETPIFG